MQGEEAEECGKPEGSATGVLRAPPTALVAGDCAATLAEPLVRINCEFVQLPPASPLRLGEYAIEGYLGDQSFAAPRPVAISLALGSTSVSTIVSSITPSGVAIFQGLQHAGLEYLGYGVPIAIDYLLEQSLHFPSFSAAAIAGAAVAGIGLAKWKLGDRPA